MSIILPFSKNLYCSKQHFLNDIPIKSIVNNLRKKSLKDISHDTYDIYRILLSIQTRSDTRTSSRGSRGFEDDRKY